MELLSKLTPAETFLILKNSTAELKDLLKYTFLDLLHKQILTTKEVNNSSDKGGLNSVYTYVIVGKNFGKKMPALHEMVYLSPYYKSKSIKILFQHIVKMGFQNAGSERSFIRKYVMKSPQLNGCFETGIFNSLFGRVKLTEHGKNLHQKIEKLIQQLEKDLPVLINTDKKKAVEILLTIQGNVFLLKNMNDELLRLINQNLMDEFQRQNHSTNNKSIAIENWVYYEYFSDYFEESYETIEDTSNNDSGCSSCSSCNSCSGCGGCGGCGGCS